MLGAGCLLAGVSPQLIADIMVGITYRSASARPSLSSANKPVFPQPQDSQQTPARGPAPSFKDKETYQELFKPLPKPEPIPVLTQFKVGQSMFNKFVSVNHILALSLGGIKIMETAPRGKRSVNVHPIRKDKM